MLPRGGSAYLTATPTGFKARPASPKGGEGLLIVQMPPALLAAAAAAGGGQWELKQGGGGQGRAASA